MTPIKEFEISFIVQTKENAERNVSFGSLNTLVKFEASNCSKEISA